VGLLAFGVARAAPARASFEVARGQALAVHQSHIADATPAVRAKITASAQAGKDWLARNPQSRDLHEFFAQDLRKRFPRATEQQLNVLMTLAFAETVSDMNQMDQLKLQDSQQKLAQVVQTISNLMKTENDTLKAIIQNMRS
jgi:hypothetical protein